MIKTRITASKTLMLLQQVKDLKASGQDIISFTAGESDFATPEEIVLEAYKSMQSGDTRYVSSQGLIELRQAVAEDYKNRMECQWSTKEHVLITAGSKQGLYLALTALASERDEVIVPSPYWVSYPSLVKCSHAKAVFLETSAQNNYFPTIAELEKAKSNKTKALLFSSPSNPSSKLIDPTLLRDIFAWCLKNNICLIFDEIYERLVYGDTKHLCPGALIKKEEELENLILINACSKSMAMTGWRLGYLLSSKKNVEALTAIQSQMLTCVAPFIQKAGVWGINNANAFLPEVVQSFKSRRDLMCSLLSEKGFEHTKAEGAFYSLVNVDSLIKDLALKDDVEFAKYLLEKQKLAVVPGSSFGIKNHIRLSFACSEQDIKEGVKRLCL